MATINPPEPTVRTKPDAVSPVQERVAARLAAKPSKQKPTTQKSAASAGSMFRVLWRWHFYAGMLIAPVLIVLSVTGGLYVFRSDIEGLARSNMMYVEPGTTKLSYQTQVDAALAAYPGWQPSQLEVRPEANRATVITLRQPRPEGERMQRGEGGGRRQRPPTKNVFVDPYQATVLGDVQSDDALTGFFNTVLQIHRNLFIGTTGRVLTELATGWSIILIGTGIYLWWPRKSSKAAGVWKLRWAKAKAYTRLRDLHTVFGMYLAPIALTIAVTGMFYTVAVGRVIHDGANHLMEDEEAPAAEKVVSSDKTPADKVQVASVAGASKAADAEASDVPAAETAKTPDLPLDDVVAILAREYPERIFFATIGEPMFPRREENLPKGMQVGAGTDWNASYGPFLSTQMILAPGTGEIVSRKHLSEGGHFWHGWTYPLHVGSVGGFGTKIFWFLACIVLTILPVTGVWMWWQRRPSKSLGLPRKPERSIPWWIYAGIVTLCILMPIVGASVLLFLASEGIYRLATRNRTPAMAAVALLVCVVLTGCSESPEVGQVSGQVLLNGKPASGMEVVFNAETVPEGGSAVASGVTDDEGRFQLTATQQGDMDAQQGVLTGKHRVVIRDIAAQATTNFDPMADSQQVTTTKRPRIGNHLSSLQTTPLTFQVTTGEQHLQIDLNGRGGAATVKPIAAGS